MLKIMFNMLQPYTKILLFICLLFLFFWGGNRYGFKSADLQWTNRWMARDLADSVRLAEAEKQQRKTEQHRQIIIDEESSHAEMALAKARGDATAADRIADQLQQQLRSLKRQLAGSETRRLSEAAGLRQAKSEAAVLLAELLQESDTQAGNYAKQADEAYITGRQCEAIYDRTTSR